MNYVFKLTILVSVVAISYSCSKCPCSKGCICNYETMNYVDSIDTNGLILRIPQFSSIDLVCGTMPSKTDTAILLVAEAAYTGDTLNVFNHSNIAGDHVSNGRRFNGYRCESNTGAFVFYKGKWKFCYQSYTKELDSAAAYGGMAFAQELIIYDKKPLKTIRPDSNRNQFRALCNYKGSLCVVESKGQLLFGDFREKLLNIGISDAIYLDMGIGWNYAWYRNDTGIVEIHEHSHNYCTNWITFYK